MKTLKLTRVVAILLMASSLGAISVRAATCVAVSPLDLKHLCEVADKEGACPRLSDLADINPAPDEGSMFGRIAATHVLRDVAGRDISGTTLQLELGPQYVLSAQVTLDGEWEPHQPAFVPARPSIDEYTFGLRFLF